jgi:hypothetical protein
MRADMRDDRGPGETPRRLRITPQVVLGLLVVGFGLVLLLDNLGVADADRVLRYWPLGLVLIGGMKLTQRGQSGRVFGALLLFIGLGLTAEHVLYLPVDADDWWPVVLIGFGVLILARAFGTRTAPRRPRSSTCRSSRPGPASSAASRRRSSGAPI